MIATGLLFGLSVLVLTSGYISPETFWPSALLTLVVIPILLLNLGALLILAIKRSWRLLLPLLIVLGGLPFLPQLYAWSSDQPAPTAESFRVVNYNTSFFRASGVFSQGYYSSDKNLLALQITDWIRSNDADIICLQEFFDDTNSEIFNNLQTISASGGYEHYFLHKSIHDNGVERGLITFSKFPIVAKGAIFMSDNRYNGATFVDLRINADTIRVINVHLESLSLSERTRNGSVVSAVKTNAIRKSQQASEVIRCVRQSPYPTLVCGDFNEVPTGFIYRQFGQPLKNAFEQRGSGLGLTYQGDYPTPLLRIDHQFYDPTLRIISFTTYYGIGYSDHFPIEARYHLP